MLTDATKRPMRVIFILPEVNSPSLFVQKRKLVALVGLAISGRSDALLGLTRR